MRLFLGEVLFGERMRGCVFLGERRFFGRGEVRFFGRRERAVRFLVRREREGGAFLERRVFFWWRGGEGAFSGEVRCVFFCGCVFWVREEG